MYHYLQCTETCLHGVSVGRGIGVLVAPRDGREFVGCVGCVANSEVEGSRCDAMPCEYTRSDEMCMPACDVCKQSSQANIKSR